MATPDTQELLEQALRSMMDKRDELLQYVIDRKAQAGVLSEMSDKQIREWARNRSTDFLQTIANGLWKDELGAAGLLR